MRGMKQHRGEDGLVAIIVATIIMVILSLITLGFARLMQREQRQALDRSLSTQAFYAAESAVNDAVKAVQDLDIVYNGDDGRGNKRTCATDAIFDGQVNAAEGSSYTCLLIDQAPPTLEYTQGSISTSTSRIIPVRADSGVSIGSMSFAWEDPNLPTTDPAVTSTPVFNCGASTLPAVTAWNTRTPGILRLDVIPANALSRQSLIDNTVSLYLYPSSANCNGAGTTTINYTDNNDVSEKGKLVRVNCTAGRSPRDCELILNMDMAAPKPTQYYVRVKSIYHSSDMTLRIYDTSATPVQQPIRGAQVQIDATGKVNDILRRVQVRVPVSKSFPIPEFVLQTTDSICKQIQVAPAPANIVDNSSCPL